MGNSIDREKVIKRLEEISDYFFKVYHRSKYREEINKAKDRCDAVEDVLAILKEQEPVEPIISYGTFRCGNCENIVGYNDGNGCGYQNNFCSNCGKAVKWT